MSYHIYNKSAEQMQEIENGFVQAIITSPPYNCGMEYDAYNDNRPWEEYFSFLRTILKECYRILQKGGRLCINVADLYRNPYIPLHHILTKICTDLGFLIRGEIIWYKKGSTVFHSTAWGSFNSPSNPILRASHEYILVFCKDEYKLQSIHGNIKSDLTPEIFETITREEWTIETTHTKKNRHPAPFPELIPERLIKLYTFIGDWIVDPFLGSGTTIAMAKRFKRNGIGYEVSKTYCKWAEQRIKFQDCSIQQPLIKKSEISLKSFFPK